MNGDKGATQSFLDLLRDDQQGLLFVSDAILPGHSFIAIEAIWWAIQHGEDIDDEQNSLELFQVYHSWQDSRFVKLISIISKETI